MQKKRYDRALAEAKKVGKARLRHVMSRVNRNEAIADIARDLGVSRQRISYMVNRERQREAKK